jgi:hypothetical protein
MGTIHQIENVRGSHSIHATKTTATLELDCRIRPPDSYHFVRNRDRRSSPPFIDSFSWTKEHAVVVVTGEYRQQRSQFRVMPDKQFLYGSGR